MGSYSIRLRRLEVRLEGFLITRNNGKLKNTLIRMVRQEEIVSRLFPKRSLISGLAKIKDYGLEYSIQRQNGKNAISGRNIAWGRPKISPMGRSWGNDFVNSSG